MKFHDEILSAAQRQVLPKLGPFATQQGFYLAGGTAVALYLGHRESVDFDWFARGEVEDPLVLAGLAQEQGLPLENPQTSAGTLHVVVGGVRVSFFRYPYAEISMPSKCEEYSADLASLDDLACMKLGAIAQRGSRKDFIDLYFLANEHKPIAELVALYRRKYAVRDIVPVLTGLGYFDDAETEPPPVMIREISWEKIKRACADWSRSLAG